MTSKYQHSSKITEKHFPTSKYHLIELKDEKKPQNVTYEHLIIMCKTQLIKILSNRSSGGNM